MLKRQIKIFIVCGIISTLFDFIIYYILYKSGVNISLAKGISFFVAILLSYYMNKYWTFKKSSKSIIEMLNFYILHIVSLIVNIACNKLFFYVFGLLLVNNARMISAFILATLFSTVINFIGQKFWIFSSLGLKTMGRS